MSVLHRRREADALGEPLGDIGGGGLIVIGLWDVEARFQAQGHLHLLPFAGHSFS